MILSPNDRSKWFPVDWNMPPTHAAKRLNRKSHSTVVFLGQTRAVLQLILDVREFSAGGETEYHFYCANSQHNTVHRARYYIAFPVAH
jgi:hypothetical protein